MTRRRKLLTAGGILALGLVLSWPFRKAAIDVDAGDVPAQVPIEPLRAANGDPIAGPLPVTNPLSAPAQVAAQPASTNPATAMPQAIASLETFDIANHPALATSHDALASAPAGDPLITTQPTYSTTVAAGSTPVNQWPAELIHVVKNGDTLEKLAERYLTDPGRALEIFDLNRDQLSNPHLLPIGVELRVPLNPDRIVD